MDNIFALTCGSYSPSTVWVFWH